MKLPKTSKEFESWLPRTFGISLSQLNDMSAEGVSPCMCTGCGGTIPLEPDADTGYCEVCGKVQKVINPISVLMGLTFSGEKKDIDIPVEHNEEKPIYHTEAKVIRIPKCDFCGSNAVYDGKTNRGPWAYMCESCFTEYGVGLGLGKGQKLVIR